MSMVHQVVGARVDNDFSLVRDEIAFINSCGDLLGHHGYANAVRNRHLLALTDKSVLDSPHSLSFDVQRIQLKSHWTHKHDSH